MLNTRNRGRIDADRLVWSLSGRGVSEKEIGAKGRLQLNNDFDEAISTSPPSLTAMAASMCR